jgi:hypothetical protein
MRTFVVVVLALGCAGEPERTPETSWVERNPATLTDQSGAEFGWECSDEEQQCWLTPVEGSPAAPECEVDETPLYSVYYGDEFECRARFCQSTDTERFHPGIPHRRDMLSLCAGDRPRDGQGTPADIVDMVAAACPDFDEAAPCEYVPDACPDPR